MKDVHGGRPAQLHALQRRIDWVDESVELRLPVLCFALPPKRFDLAYKSKRPYTENGRCCKCQVLPLPHLSSDLRSSEYCNLKCCTLRAHVLHTCCVQKCQHQHKTQNPEDYLLNFKLACAWHPQNALTLAGRCLASGCCQNPIGRNCQNLLKTSDSSKVHGGS